jgi:hypothetical protein
MPQTPIPVPDIPKTKQRRIVGFSLPPELASKVKAEAGRRQIRLKVLFEEMWALYEKHSPRGKS